MISKNIPSNQIPAEVSTPYTSEGSYIDWAAIIAGGVFALAISFLLTSFGAGLGLSLTSPYQGEGVSAAWLAIASGIWFAWVMVTGFGAGGYLCGRMRRRAGDATADEVEARDGTHGLMVWATGALVGAVLAATGAGGFVNAGMSAAGTVTDVAAEAVSSEYFANVMLRSGVQEPETEATADEATPSAEGAGTAATLGRQPAQGATQAAGVDPAVQQEIAGIIARVAVNGNMGERDRSYLAQLVAANSDLGEAAARTRVDEVIAEIDEARAAALAAVEKARVAAVIFGFIAAATLLVGAAAAFFAATAGGRHRDEGLGLNFLTVRR